LVHEAYLKLSWMARRAAWERSRAFSSQVAALAMRQIIVDHLRAATPR
jgi:hypothetical protein